MMVIRAEISLDREGATPGAAQPSAARLMMELKRDQKLRAE
jgi:hypothetical protein